MVEVGSIETMLPFAVFLLGITLYAIFVFRFYRFLARKDVFNLDLKQYNRFKHKSLKKMGSIGFYILEYVIIFPVLIVFWSAIMAALLLFLSKGYDTPSVLLISMAVVGAIRFTAYYREDLAKDLAKMLPFGLLAIFLVDTQFISIVDSLEYVIQIPNHWSLIANYFIFIMVLELVLRLIHTVIVVTSGKDPTVPDEQEEKEFVLK